MPWLPIFITSNPKKSEYLSRYLGIHIDHAHIDLDEIQSTSLHEIIEHKVIQAYEKIHQPVLVEDVGLEFVALGKLPWPFIKFFEKEIGLEWLCRLLDGKSRNAIARCVFGYFDGKKREFFEWSVRWTIAEHPLWNKGYGWDPIFIPYFADTTSAELDNIGYERFYTENKPFQKIQKFLNSHNNG